MNIRKFLYDSLTGIIPAPHKSMWNINESKLGGNTIG